MAVVIERLRTEGRMVNEEDIARLSPARCEHNPYGTYRVEVEDGLRRSASLLNKNPSEGRRSFPRCYRNPL
jgi:hypothetical protein